MATVSGFVLLIIMDVFVLFLMIVLAISITGSHAIGVEQMDKKVKRGEKIPNLNLNTYIWWVTVTFGGLGVRRFVLLLTSATWLGLIVGTIVEISKLIS